MRRREPVVAWVVYEKQVPGKPKVTIICEQPEWEELTLAQRSDCVLVRAGIASEGEAEQLARSGAVSVRIKPPVVCKPPPAQPGPNAGRARQSALMAKWWAQSKRLATAKNPAEESRVGG
jgi:hypothetical protein